MAETRRIDQLTPKAAPVGPDLLEIQEPGEESYQVTAASLLQAANDGDANTPGFSFAADKDTGFFRPGDDTISMAAGGAEIFRGFSNQGIAFRGAVTLDTVARASDGTVSAVAYGFTSAANTGLYSPSTGVLGLAAGGVGVIEAANTYVSSKVAHVFAGGAAATPSITFTGDTDSGLYSVSANQVGMAAGGVLAQQWAAAWTRSVVQHRFSGGTTTLPGMAFWGDDNTGFTRPAEDNVGLVAGGIEVQRWNSGGTTMYRSQFLVTNGDAASNGNAYVTVQNGKTSEQAQLWCFSTDGTAPGGSFLDTSGNFYIRSQGFSLGMSGAAATASLDFTDGNNASTLSLLSAAHVPSNATTYAVQLFAKTDNTLRLAAGYDVASAGAVLQAYKVAGSPQKILLNPLGGAVHFTGGTAANPSISFFGNGNTGIFKVADNSIGFAANGSIRAQVDTVAFTSFQPVRASTGSQGVPSYSFSGDVDTGLFLVAGGVMGWSGNNIKGGELRSSGLRVQNGTVSAPSISFLNATNYGIRLGAGAMYLVVAGVDVIKIDANGITCNQDVKAFTAL